MTEHPYQELLTLPYPNPEIENAFPDKVLRAAQFAPFAALTGYDAAVAETARLTQNKVELSEDAKEHINGMLQMLEENPSLRSNVTVRYFVPDPRKEGGDYQILTGEVLALRKLERTLVFADGTEVPMENLAELTIE